jgi:T5SS/PEP-CTERM-associated repeat protein/autotransporter-associated beta strand protein
MFGRSLRLQSSFSVPALVLLGFAAAPTARAQEYTWNAPTTGDWSVGANWLGGTAPPSDPMTQLVFLATGTQTYTATNNIANPFVLNRVTVGNSGTGKITIAQVAGGGALTFTGTTPQFLNTGSGAVDVLTPINLAANTSFAGAGTGTVTLFNTLNDGGGGFGVNVGGAGTWAFPTFAANSIGFLRMASGTTQIANGSWTLTTPSTDAAGAFIVGSAGAQTANFSLSASADLTSPGNLYIGEAAGSTGIALVTGTGTTVTATGANTGLLAVGNNGTGSLTIADKAVVTTRLGTIGRNANSIGSVIVDGTNSQWTTNGTLTIGQSGTGSLTVQNGGRVAPQHVSLGSNAGAVGTLTVTGTGSELITPVGGALTVLRGHFIVSAGGSATASDVQVYTLTGNASVVDAGTLTVRNLFTVANGAAGQVTIRNGGVVTVGGNSTFVGTNVNSVGTLTVTGANSRLSMTGASSFLIFGGGSGAGRGDLIVENGGKVESSGTQVTFAQDTGSISVSFVDAGTLTASSATLSVAQSGTASLTFQNGGTGSVANIVAGANTNSSGTITVTGTGSNLTTAGFLRLAGSGTTPGGTATLNVQSGGVVQANGVATLFGGGTANVNAGTLRVGGLTHGTAASIGFVNLSNGGSLVILNGLDASYAGVIGGAGSFTKQGAGTQTLTGINTYSGDTTISGGTLVLSGSGSIAASPNVTVGFGANLNVAGVSGGFSLANGQTLRGSGTVTGATTAVSGSSVAPGTPTSTGTLTFNGNLTLVSGSTLAIKIRPATMDFAHDQAVMQTGVLNVTGSVLDMDGVLVPGQGTVVTIVLNTANSPVVGQFANSSVAGDPLGRLYLGDYIGNISYFGSNGTISGGNDVVVYNLAPVPEPGSIFAIAAAAGLGAVGVRRRFKRRGPTVAEVGA